MDLIIVKSESTDPYENLALEEHLTFSAKDDEIILYLWQNADTVVIGKNQNPWKECDVEKIKADAVCLARRSSGGGAVYQDAGNLNFTFIAKDPLFDVGRQTDIVVHACRLLGADVSRTGRNDLTAGGRKFSGHAYYSSGEYNYHHGTIMMDVDLDRLSTYLSVADRMPGSGGVDSVSSRVTNLIDHMGERDPREDPVYARMAGSMSETGTEERSRETSAFINALRRTLMIAAVREYGYSAYLVDAPAVPAELVDKYRSDEWIYGTRIPFTKDISHRFDWGSVEVQLSMKGGYIDDCRIYSDALETEVFGAVQSALKGCRYDAAAIAGLRSGLPHGISATAAEILGLIAGSL